MSSGQTRHIVFVTGTRADYGKLKSLIAASDEIPNVEVTIFVTGMHLLDRFGQTWVEVQNSGVGQLFPFINQNDEDSMDAILGKTISGFSDFVKARKPDLIVVHGDRVEALACACVGALNNILVAHVEGGELSGTVDGLIRHAITKMSHIHLASNEEAASTLYQLGEARESVFLIGSPDIDVMESEALPNLDEVKAHYGFDFNEYGILLFHPVTTELDQVSSQADEVADGVLASGLPFIVVLPNNDAGSGDIVRSYRRFEGAPSIRVYPSIRFEAFLTLLRNARVIVGNSSAGIREAPHFGVPTVNVGSRQMDRVSSASVIDVAPLSDDISRGVAEALQAPRTRSRRYGAGDSAQRFRSLLESDVIWGTTLQKRFVVALDIDSVTPRM